MKLNNDFLRNNDKWSRLFENYFASFLQWMWQLRERSREKERKKNRKTKSKKVKETWKHTEK